MAPYKYDRKKEKLDKKKMVKKLDSSSCTLVNCTSQSMVSCVVFY